MRGFYNTLRQVLNPWLCNPRTDIYIYYLYYIQLFWDVKNEKHSNSNTLTAFF